MLTTETLNSLALWLYNTPRTEQWESVFGPASDYTEHYVEQTMPIFRNFITLWAKLDDSKRQRLVDAVNQKYGKADG